MRFIRRVLLDPFSRYCDEILQTDEVSRPPFCNARSLIVAFGLTDIVATAELYQSSGGGKLSFPTALILAPRVHDLGIRLTDSRAVVRRIHGARRRSQNDRSSKYCTQHWTLHFLHLAQARHRCARSYRSTSALPPAKTLVRRIGHEGGVRPIFRPTSVDAGCDGLRTFGTGRFRFFRCRRCQHNEHERKCHNGSGHVFLLSDSG